MSENDVTNEQESTDEQVAVDATESPDDQSVDVAESPDAQSVDATESSDEQESADAAESSDGQDPKPKKKMKLGIKILMVVGIVIVVLAGGGGVAYATLHDNPAFCNFLCHTPMDPYVESYQNGISINAAQADSDAKLSVTLHKESDQDITCLTCHVTSMSEQINEGLHWVSGDYELPLEMKVVAKQIEEEPGGDKNGITFCLRPECHEGIASLDDLKKATDDRHRNPHDSHLGNQDCSNCHQTHEQSVLVCSQCHADAEVPDGWLTYKEQQDQKKQLAAQ
jgi:flagellar basal body-associated protein FliL